MIQPRLIIILLLIGTGLLPGPGEADIILKGRAGLDHREGPPLSGVQVQAAGRQSTTDSTGNYTLTLPDSLAGKTMAVTASTPRGLQLLTQFQKRFFIPEMITEELRCDLVFCTPSDQQRARYDHFLSTLRQMTSRALTDHFEPVERYTTTYTSLKKPALMAAPFIAWHVSSADRTGLPDITQRIYDAIEAGNATRAFELLSISGNSPTYIGALFKFAALQFSEAEQDLVAIQTHALSNHVDAPLVPYTRALFASLQARYDEVPDLLNAVDQQNPSLELRLFTAAHRASIALFLQDYETGRTAAESAVTLCREIYATDKSVAPVLAANLILQAALTLATSTDRDQAEPFELAVRIADQLDQIPENPTTHYLTNPFALGVLNQYWTDIYYARLHGPEQRPALNFQETIIKLLPAFAREEYAMYLYSVQDLVHFQKQKLAAIDYLYAAKEHDPTRTVHHVLTQMAFDFADQHPNTPANESRRARLYQLASDSSRASLSYVDGEQQYILRCQALNAMAELHIDGNRPRQAVEMLTKVNHMYTTPTPYPQTTIDRLFLQSLHIQARIESATGRPKEAIAHLKQALTLHQKYTAAIGTNKDKRDTTTIVLGHLLALANQQLLQYEKSNMQHAQNIKAAQELPHLSQRERDYYECRALTGIARNYVLQKQPRELAKIMPDLLLLGSDLFAHDPTAYLFDYVEVHQVNAAYHKMSRRYKQASDAYKTGLELLDQTPSSNLERSVATAGRHLIEMAFYHAKTNNHARAIAVYQQAEERLMPLYQSFPQTYYAAICECYIGMIPSYYGTQNKKGAKATYAKADKLLSLHEQHLTPQTKPRMDDLRSRLAKFSSGGGHARQITLEHLLRQNLGGK